MTSQFTKNMYIMFKYLQTILKVSSSEAYLLNYYCNQLTYQSLRCAKYELKYW